MQLHTFRRHPDRAMRHFAASQRTTMSRAALGLTMLLTVGLSSATAHAQTYVDKTLASFTSSALDGINPKASLVYVNGKLYGTASTNGANSEGTIFSFDPSTNTETTLYSFQGGSNDGANPQAGLTYDSGTGKLYGTAEFGGTASHGTVFSFDPSNNSESTLHNFQGGGTDGGQPLASLVDVNGTLFGTASIGGSNSGGGTVFSLVIATNAYLTLRSFTGTNGDGANLTTDLIYDSAAGKLYGTTTNGGINGQGTVFSMDATTYAEQTLYSFTDTNGDGEFPKSGLLEINGILYGTTSDGGKGGDGTIYSLDPASNNETSVYSFTGTNGDGAQPIGDLINVNGTVYGATSEGGTASDGTVFVINLKTNSETPVHSFTDTSGDGDDPQAGLVNVIAGGIDTVYGTTYGGGSTGNGSIFSVAYVTPPVAHNDACTIQYQTTRTNAAPGVLGNDSSGNSSSLTATLVTGTTHGSITLNANGSFTYTPNTGYVGSDSFTYRIANPQYQGSIGTVTLNVVAVTPIAHPDSCSIAYEKARTNAAPGVLANDFNGGSTPLTAALVTNVSHGTLTLGSDGSFTYTPNTGYAGTDSFTYQVSNAVGKGTIGTVTLTVIQTTPTAHNDACTIAHNKARTNAAPGVLGNDDNGGEGPLTAKLVSGTTHGSITLNSDGSFTYTPNTGYSGTDTFTYQVSNPIGKGTIGTVTLTVE